MSVERQHATFHERSLARVRLIGMALAALVLSLLAQWVNASEAGLPPVQSFTPADYQGGVQNWAVVQDQQGLVYVGNGDPSVVLQFDGVDWRRIKLPGQTTVRALGLGNDAKVYVGAQGEFGYLAPDPVGELRYISLMPLLTGAERDFADVRRIHAIGDDVYFFTAQRLFRLRGGRVRSWSAKTPFHFSFKVGKRLFLRSDGAGLEELVDDALVPVPGGERFAAERVYVMLPWPSPEGREDGHILVGTRTAGWMRFDGRDTWHPWSSQADERLLNDLLYGAEPLANGGMALSTLQGGLILLDQDGKQTGRLDTDSGLPDNAVFATHTDGHNGLWLGLGAGVARIGVGGALSRFEPLNGLEGTMLSLERHAGHLYAGTTTGLFRLDTTPGANARFVQVPELPTQIWDLETFDTSLLTTSANGVFEVRDGGAVRKVLSEGHGVSLLRSRIDPSRVFLGTTGGLRAMRAHDGGWVQEALDVTTGDIAYTLIEDPQGRIWIGTQASHVYRVSFPSLAASGTLAAPRVERFDDSHGLTGPTDVFAVGGDAVFATSAGLLRFDEASSRFVPVPGLDALFPDGVLTIGPVFEDASERLWMHVQHAGSELGEVGVATKSADGGYQWDSAAFQPIAGASYTALHVDDDGTAWFGGVSVLHRYDPRQHPPGTASRQAQAFSALLRRVSGRDKEIIFGGAGIPPAIELAHTQNALRFEFSAPFYEAMQENRFQVFLEGVDPGWSPWSAESYRDYTQLPSGTHRFRVRSRNVFGTISEEAAFEFRMLPPWYLTWWAYLAYGLLAVATVWAMIRWRSAALLSQNEDLARLVEQRTGELSQANQALVEQNVTDPLTGLKNRRYLLHHIDHEVAFVDRAYAEAIGEAPPRNADLMFLMVDIDHFKEINDRFGHAAGDRVLEQFRDLLLSAARKSDTPVRWGGEEFLIVSRNAESGCGHILAERIRDAVANHLFDLGDGQHIHRTCSVGFAGYPLFRDAPQHLGWEKIVEVADQCLYLAKNNGRNTWVGASSPLSSPPANFDERLGAGIESLAVDGTLHLTRLSRPEAASD